MEVALIARIGTARYQMWFPQHVAFTFNSSELFVSTKTTQFQEWLKQTFADAIAEAACEVIGTNLTVQYRIDAEAVIQPETPKSPVARTLFGDEPTPQPRPKRTSKRDTESVTHNRSTRRYKSLDDFALGPCNRVAHSAALALLEDPGQVGNPLVFFGPTGTGKSHLLEGVYSGLRRSGGDGRPVLTTAEEFTTKFVQSTRFHTTHQFRRQFRECSALLLDDLSFLATKRATQDEFLHTLDFLVAEGRPVVVTLDCHPRLADDLIPELDDRLLGGSVWGLMPPEDETRLTILRQKAKSAQPEIADDVLIYLARNLHGNVRELEGAIHTLRHYARAMGRVIDIGVTRDALGDLLRHSIRTISIDDVEAAVSKVVSLPTGVMRAAGRSWAVSHPRMLAVFIARKHTSSTFGDIARHFGLKQHSTAMAAEKKVRGWILTDERLCIGNRDWSIKELIARIERELQR
jgi:chromosomal replication initiator protein